MRLLPEAWPDRSKCISDLYIVRCAAAEGRRGGCQQRLGLGFGLGLGLGLASPIFTLCAVQQQRGGGEVVSKEPLALPPASKSSPPAFDD